MTPEGRQSLPWNRLAIVVAPIVAVAGVVLARAAPGRFALIAQEDGPMEWATFALFAVAAGLAMHRVFSAERQERLALIALCAFCVFVAGEEISWGQRLVSFKPPELFLEKNYQQEANLHNLLKDLLDTRWVVTAVAVTYGLAAPVAARRWRWLRPFAPALACTPAAVAVAAIEIAYPMELAGELAELLLGMFFVHDLSVRRDNARGALITYGAALVAGVGLPPFLDATLYRPEEAMVARAQAELLDLQHHVETQLRPRMFAVGRMHKRVYTAATAGYFAPIEGEGRHALDPWQQPYWIMVDRRTPDRGLALLYSFGPNRRRDTLLEHLPSSPETEIMRGDDMGVLFELRR